MRVLAAFGLAGAIFVLAPAAWATGWQPLDGDRKIEAGEEVRFEDPAAASGAYDGVLFQVTYDGEPVYEGRVNDDGTLGPVEPYGTTGVVSVIVGVSPESLVYPDDPQASSFTLEFSSAPSIGWPLLLVIPAALIFAMGFLLRRGLRRPPEPDTRIPPPDL